MIKLSTKMYRNGINLFNKMADEELINICGGMLKYRVDDEWIPTDFKLWEYGDKLVPVAHVYVWNQDNAAWEPQLIIVPDDD